MNKTEDMNPNSVSNMRPPSFNPGFNGQINAPMEAMQRAQQASNRMPSGNWQQQGPQGGQPQQPTKKNSTANANAPTPSSEAEPPPTPTPSTPITLQHPSSFNSQKGPNAAAPAGPPTSAPVPQGPPPPQQPDPAQVSAFPDTGMRADVSYLEFPDFSFQLSNSTQQNFNLDFSTLDTGDVLENFDFDSFLNTDDQAGFSFDPTLSYPTDGVEATGDV
jgi:hypothetical protein